LIVVVVVIVVVSLFSGSAGFISTIPQLAWIKKLGCCCSFLPSFIIVGFYVFGIVCFISSVP
jgi:hypothetical protein